MSGHFDKEKKQVLKLSRFSYFEEKHKMRIGNKLLKPVV